MLSIN